MIKRIVKLTFQLDKTDDFLAVFAENRLQIRQFPGCNYLEVWRDQQDPRIFFTYSFWESEAALNAYRHSDLFKSTWQQTKALFADRPQAWTVTLHDIVRPNEK
ncbi:MAG: antibiotic biosynthesis monooxygenase family protein [Bacteroidota bacterium]